ncbi:hypothetical protein OROHE_009199 [Orobanche hederae]
MDTKLNIDLCRAAEKGDLGRVKELINKGADVNFTAYNDLTPILYAIENGHDGVLWELIDCGADINGAQEFAKDKNNEFAIKKLKEIEAYGSIEVPFLYDTRTGHGTLTKIGCNVSIDRSQQNSDSFKRHLQLCMKVDHKAFLFVTGKEDLSIHNRFRMSLFSYLEQHKCAPFDTYAIPNSSCQYEYLVDFYKIMFRDMTDFITYLHRKGISIAYADFTINNIVVKDDRIIFFGVLLRDADNDSKKEDLKALGSLIKDVLVKGAALAQAALAQGAVPVQGAARTQV